MQTIDGKNKFQGGSLKIRNARSKQIQDGFLKTRKEKEKPRKAGEQTIRKIERGGKLNGRFKTKKREPRIKEI